MSHWMLSLAGVSLASIVACGASQAPCPCREPAAAPATSATCATGGPVASSLASSDPAASSSSAPSPTNAAVQPASPVDYDAMSNHVTAALYKSKDGDGPGCLRSSTQRTRRILGMRRRVG